MKFLICLFVLASNLALADDSVRVTVGTQTYHCELGAELNCTAINEVQQKTIMLKKSGGEVGAEDKAHKLSASVLTTLSGTNVVYEMTICSSKTCSLTSTTSDSSGAIDQVVSGQYNITEASFDVIGFFITTNTGMTNFQDKIQQRISKLKL